MIINPTHQNFILFDDFTWHNLLPLTFTKPVSALRTGILTIKEKWDYALNSQCSFLTKDYLNKKFPLTIGDDNILINASCLPDKHIVDDIMKLKTGEAIITEDKLIAVRTGHKEANSFNPADKEQFNCIKKINNITAIKHLWDLFSLNGIATKADFEVLTRGKKSQPISATNKVLNPNNVFIEEGATVEFAIINAEKGPVYIGKNAEVMEGCIIRGPFALCEYAVLKMGAKIYGPTTIGPYCKAGGEINNSVLSAYSNKAHDGFLGNSVIGEWCNIGADTNTSNLRNDYGKVKLWNYNDKKFIDTGLQFCGLIMGDHAKCGINTMFNTGTVVGVNANVFDTGFIRNYVPSFSWGGIHGFKTFKLPKAFQVAEKVMERRKISFNDIEKNILNTIFDMTKKYRTFEHKC